MFSHRAYRYESAPPTTDKLRLAFAEGYCVACGADGPAVAGARKKRLLTCPARTATTSARSILRPSCVHCTRTS